MMKKEDLQAKLAAHKNWLNNKEGGQRADLQGADLRWANLQGANLQGADLRWANLQGANLRWANLKGANLRWANLKGITWNSYTVWPGKFAFTNAENIPEKLKKELGITP